MGLAVVLWAWSSGFLLALRAIQRPREFLVGSAVVGTVGLGSAAAFTHLWGLPGAAASTLLAYSVGAAVYYRLYRARMPRS